MDISSLFAFYGVGLIIFCINAAIAFAMKKRIDLFNQRAKKLERMLEKLILRRRK